MIRTSWLSALAGAAAAALVLLPLAGDVGDGRVAGSGATAVPDRLGSYSHLTADVSQAPPGPAVALYQHGYGVELFDFPQAVVLAAGGDVYRRLDEAEARAGAETQGDPGPMLLSPDGRSVALGDHDAVPARLGVVDLRSGDVVDHELPQARSVRPVAWSPDGGRVAYLARPTASNPHRGFTQSGRLLVLDLATRRTAPVPGGAVAVAAAFSPDGQELAVQRPDRTGGLAVVDLTSRTARTVGTSGRLAGPAAWSPDGRRLAVASDEPVGQRDLLLVDPHEEGGAVPARTVAGPEDPGVLGWTGPREVALLDRTDDDTIRLVSRPVDGGAARTLMRLEDQGSYGVGGLQLATGLVRDGLDVRPAGEPDRGPSSAGVRVAEAGAVGLGVAALVGLVLRRRRRG